MQNISFGSNYTINIDKNTLHNKAIDKIYNYETKGAQIFEDFTLPDEASKTGIFEKILISAPDKFDDKIEGLLLHNGVNFRKQTFNQAMNLDNIKNRICLSETDILQGRYLAVMNVEKLNELFKNDDISYIQPDAKNGFVSRYQGVEEYLKTGRKINAPQVYFQDNEGILAAGIQDGRHRFAFLRDLGMKEIPVSLDKCSIEIAQKFGLI